MSSKSVIPGYLKEAEFLSKKAGSFSEVPQKTVQSWTEKGLLIADTTGTGDRRKYTALNCIEIGIIKSLVDSRISLDVVSRAMKMLRTKQPTKHGRRPTLEILLAEDEGFLFVDIPKSKRDKPSYFAYSIEDEETFRDSVSLRDDWFKHSGPADCDKTLTININRIARRIVQNMK